MPQKIHKQLLIIMCLILIGGVSAADYNSIQFNPGDLMNITGMQCLEQNNTPCHANINCTITVINDTQDFVASNITMLVISPDGFRNHNLGLAPNYTTTWSGVFACKNGGVEEFVIEIGEAVSDWETALIIGFIGIIFIFGIMGFTIFSKEYWLIKSGLFISSLLLSVTLVNSAKIISVGSNSSKIMSTALMVSITVISIMFLYVFVLVFKEIIYALKEKRGVRWK